MLTDRHGSRSPKGGPRSIGRRASYHRTRAEANEALTGMKAARWRGVAHHTGRSPRLADHLVTWLRDSVAVSVGPKTLEGYEVYVARLDLGECVRVLAASPIPLSSLAACDPASSVDAGEDRDFEGVIRDWTLTVLSGIEGG